MDLKEFNERARVIYQKQANKVTSLLAELTGYEKSGYWPASLLALQGENRRLAEQEILKVIRLERRLDKLKKIVVQQENQKSLEELRRIYAQVL
jgi:hypothetical protein